jgi:heme-degrading monooxygenase HmoA
MHARHVTIQGDASRIDDAIGSVQAGVLPGLQGSDGFKGFTLLVDRSAGTAIGISYWESPEALEASEAAIRQAREETVRASGGDQPQIRIFEVAIDVEA